MHWVATFSLTFHSLHVALEVRAVTWGGDFQVDSKKDHFEALIPFNNVDNPSSICENNPFHTSSGNPTFPPVSFTLADVANAKYHVITNATYNSDPVPAKFKHVTNIETCTLVCCDYSTLWEALHANMVEIGARCSDKNVKILGRYQWIGW